MILSLKGEGAFCSPGSRLRAAQVFAVNQILDALRAGGVNGYRVHGWHIDSLSIEPIGFSAMYGIQFKAVGLPGKPVLQILLNDESRLADIFVGKLLRRKFAGKKMGERIQLHDLAATINRQFAVSRIHSGGCHDK